MSKVNRHRGKVVMLRMPDGGTRNMSARTFVHLQGCSKGGQVTASRPNPGRFTSETGRKAATKIWATRWRYNKHIKSRTGRASKYAPRVMRGALRTYYALHETRGIRYYFPTEYSLDGFWLLTVVPGVVRRITERTALRRLGHLPRPYTGFIPTNDQILQVLPIFPSGMKAA